VKNDFGVAVGCELMPARFQFGAQLNVIEDFAVEDNPQRAVLVSNRLLAAGEINDTQARVAKPHIAAKIDAEFVGTPMTDHAEHSTDRLLVRPRGVVKNASYSTHFEKKEGIINSARFW
jgi:hypothetical protein